VDATIAAAAAMTIRRCNDLDGDAFCILWDGKELRKA
jgi:hypothetical protein